MTSRLLYVCDNRDDSSWGSRASSVALGQQLICHGELTGVGRSWATKPIPAGAIVSQVHRHRYGSKALRHVWSRRLLSRGLGRLGNFADFVALDPSVSVARFRRSAPHDPALSWLKQQLELADAVVVNGEGSLVFRHPPRRDVNFQLFVVELAAELGKPVCYINALASDCPYSGTNRAVEAAVLRTLQKCSSVVARDPMSQRRLEALGLGRVDMAPDALFTWRQRYPGVLAHLVGGETPELFDSWPESDRFFRGWSDWSAEYVCVGGASRHPHQDISEWPAFFGSLVQTVRETTGLPVVLIESGGDRFLEEVAHRTGSILIRPALNLLLATSVVANASALVSGRFHPSVMASLGGTPCTFLECGAHKTLSLQEQLEYADPKTFPIEPSTANVSRIVDDLGRQLAGQQARREEISRVTDRLGEDARGGIRRALETLLDGVAARR